VGPEWDLGSQRFLPLITFSVTGRLKYAPMMPGNQMRRPARAGVQRQRQVRSAKAKAKAQHQSAFRCSFIAVLPKAKAAKSRTFKETGFSEAS
jgi:hypothetical protein